MRVVDVMPGTVPPWPPGGSARGARSCVTAPQHATRTLPGLTIQLGTIPDPSADLVAAVDRAATVPSPWPGDGPEATDPDFTALFQVPAHTGPVLGGQCASMEDCNACWQT